MSHKLRYTVTASFGGYFWPLMMVSRVSALAICVAWTHMNWAASEAAAFYSNHKLSRPLSSNTTGTTSWPWFLTIFHQNLILSSTILFGSVWTSSLFIEFEFYRASELQVRTHNEFKFLPFFELKLEFEDNFYKFWPEFFKYFKFYWVWVCLKHKPTSSSLIEFEFLSFE